MKVVILCGGYGTRIRDVADDIPKPMIPIGDRPILWHIMKYYSTFGFNDFVLCLGYKSDVVKKYFLDYEVRADDFQLVLGEQAKVTRNREHDEMGWKITLAETGLDSMTGSRVSKIKEYIGEDEDFMLTYGDGVGDVDIASLVKFHKAHGKIGTLTGVRPPARFGELEFDASKKVTGFNEKSQTSAGRINGGFFVLNRKIFDYLSDDEKLVFEQEPIKQLVADDQLMVFEHDGFWQCMDTSREYKLLNGLYNEKKAVWVKW